MATRASNEGLSASCIHKRDICRPITQLAEYAWLAMICGGVPKSLDKPVG